MLRLILTLLLTLSLWSLFSQNLVTNGDFEIYSSCPIALGTGNINLTTFWHSPTSHTGTPDYYNICSPFIPNGSELSVPQHLWGGCSNGDYDFQYPHSGNGYAGIFCYWPNQNLREYIQTKLNSTLIKGRTYCVSMYVSLAGISGKAVDGMGIYFSQNAIIGTGGFGFLPYEPQIKNPTGNIINDTLNWTCISGSYTAAGNEDYITIGNFKSDTATKTQSFGGCDNGGGGFGRTYYYVDDVSVTDSTLTISTSSNETIACDGDQVVLIATGAKSYTWMDAANKSVIIGTGPTITFSASVSKTYVVYASGVTCSGGVDSITVNVNPVPIINLHEDTALCFEETGSIVLKVDQGYSSYLWTDLSVGDSLLIHSPGKYFVTITDSNDCSQTDTTYIADMCDLSLYYPNAFTPNGDGLDDRFYFIGNLIEQFEIKIYDRWGDLIFQTNDIDQGWDGSKNNIPLQEDVYAWNLSYRGKGNSPVATKYSIGHVVLVR